MLILLQNPVAVVSCQKFNQSFYFVQCPLMRPHDDMILLFVRKRVAINSALCWVMFFKTFLLKFIFSASINN